MMFEDGIPHFDLDICTCTDEVLAILRAEHLFDWPSVAVPCCMTGHRHGNQVIEYHHAVTGSYSCSLTASGEKREGLIVLKNTKVCTLKLLISTSPDFSCVSCLPCKC